MSRPATLLWFARHELRLVWRDWLSMMTAGKRSREPLVALTGLSRPDRVHTHLFSFHHELDLSLEVTLPTRCSASDCNADFHLLPQ